MVPAMANDDDKLTTYSAAAKLLRRNPRTVRAALEGLTPDQPSKDGRPARWKLGTVKAALDRRAVVNADYVRNGASSSTASLTRGGPLLAVSADCSGLCRRYAAGDVRSWPCEKTGRSRVRPFMPPVMRRRTFSKAKAYVSVAGDASKPGRPCA